MSETILVDLVPDEILTTQSSITFKVPEGTDPSLLGRLVSVRGANGAVRATRARNQFRWSAAEGLAPGHYRLVFDSLTDDRSRRG